MYAAHMATTSLMFHRISIPLALCLCAASAAAGVPAFSAADVVNAASFAPGAVAPGEMVSIFGAELGPTEPSGMQLSADNRYVATRLAGTRVLFDGIAAPLTYVSSKQVNAVVPLGVKGKSSTRVQVEYLGVLSPVVAMPVARTSHGVFTSSGKGQGQGAVLNWPGNTVNGAGSPASRGSLAIVYATAGGWEGPASEDGRVAEAAVRFPIAAAATVGDVPAEVLYAGSAPSFVTGVLQVNLRIAGWAPPGDAVPLLLSIDGVRSQAGVTMAVQRAGTGAGITLCSPYSVKANVYKGQMHCHSTNSDGKQAPADVVRAYKEAGYDFVALTDHGRVAADPAVPGILFLPGMEQAPSGRHLNRIGGAKAALSGEVQPLIDRALAEDEFVFLNHPNWPGGYPADPNWSDADFAAARGFHGVEVWNSLVQPNSNAEGRIDNLLSQRRRLLLVATDDCHDQANGNCRTGSTRVFADRLDASEILGNLKAGNFYASNGAEISSIAVADRTITVRTVQPGAIEFIAAGGRVVKSASGATSASYTAAGDEIYVRARVTRGSDKKMAWSNPIWVER